MVADAADQAVWLVEGFVPGPKSIGVIEAVKMGANLTRCYHKWV